MSRTLWILLGSFAVSCGVEAVNASGEAHAGTSTDSIETVGCDLYYPPQAGSTNQGFWWAEKAYPGRSKAELAKAVVMFCGADDPAGPAGYPCFVSNGFRVRDGAISMGCGYAAADKRPTISYTIILPPKTP